MLWQGGPAGAVYGYAVLRPTAAAWPRCRAPFCLSLSLLLLLQGIVPFVAVDCDREANRPLCSKYGVQVLQQRLQEERMGTCLWFHLQIAICCCSCTVVAQLILVAERMLNSNPMASSWPAGIPHVSGGKAALGSPEQGSKPLSPPLRSCRLA